MGFSVEAAAKEMISVVLARGTYFVGVIAFAGEGRYHLRVLPPAP